MKKHHVWNNTGFDLRTDDDDEAAAAWDEIEPREGAGDKYAPFWDVECEICGESHSKFDEFDHHPGSSRIDDAIEMSKRHLEAHPGDIIGAFEAAKLANRKN